MEWRISWTAHAVDDLRSIVVYVGKDNPAVASRMGNEILTKVEQIAHYPNSGRVVPEVGIPEIREGLIYTYRIIYETDKASRQLFVLRIWHAKRGNPEFKK